MEKPQISLGIVEITDIKTTLKWLLENGEFEDIETAYNISMNSINIIEDKLGLPKTS